MYRTKIARFIIYLRLYGKIIIICKHILVLESCKLRTKQQKKIAKKFTFITHIHTQKNKEKQKQHENKASKFNEINKDASNFSTYFIFSRKTKFRSFFYIQSKNT